MITVDVYAVVVSLEPRKHIYLNHIDMYAVADIKTMESKAQ